MANTLSVYNPTFYAQEALILLEKALGMAGRVHRAFEAEKSREPGDTVAIRKPSTFSAQNAPSSAQDINASSVSIVLNQWKEVKFGLTDKELAYTGERIIADHIRPAAYALADNIDQALCALWKDVPWFVDFSGPAVASDLTNARKVLFNNSVPMDPAMLSFMVSGDIEAELLNLQAFSQFQGAGPAGVETQMRGQLGTRYGMNFFSNQNVQSATSATVADLAGAINNGPGYAAGTTSLVVDGFSISAALKEGDIVVITGHTQQYVLAADVTLDGAGAGTLVIDAPGLAASVLDNAVVTITLSGGSGTTKAQNLAFHRNAFALVMAALPETGNNIGARIATVSDPVTGLSLRSRLYYDGDASKVLVALDCLFGVKTLDGNLAVRARD